MSGNILGKILQLATFGESHGEALGGVLDGVPAGITLDMELIGREMARRRPGQSAIVTSRQEADNVRLLSGIFEGKTTGTPIGFIIENQNQHSADYGHIADSFRPSHADFTYTKKYGIRDYRGGGRSSARETAARIAGGSIARQIIPGITFTAYVTQVGNLCAGGDPTNFDFSNIEKNPVRCPDMKAAAEMEKIILEVKKAGDTIGGIVECVIKNVPVGLGEPVFDRLEAELAKAMLSIPATKGFEIGSGFGCVSMRGSEHNDLFNPDGTTQTNRSGGIQGGISNGMDIIFRVAFKPVATIMRDQPSIDKDGNPVIVSGKGRHDPCVVPRAVPIVEAMAALVLADFYLQSKATHI